MNIFASRLKKLRTERCVSRILLAIATKTSYITICRLENNRVDVWAKHLVRFAKFFGVSTDYLLGLKDE